VRAHLKQKCQFENVKISMFSNRRHGDAFLKTHDFKGRIEFKQILFYIFYQTGDKRVTGFLLTAF
jgi:hypothetical protein